MNDLQKLERIQHFFLAVRRRWVWMLLSLAVACGGSLLMKNMENTESVWFSCIRYVVLAAILFVLFWVSSIFVINKIKKKRAEIYTKGLPNAAKPEEKAQISFSRLLSLRERVKAYLNFKELHDASDYCFLGGPPSYLRVQWLKPEAVEPHEPKELVYSWPCDNNRLDIDFDFENEETRLTVQRVCSEDGESVFACLTSLDPTRNDHEASQGVQLILDEPCLVTYEYICEQPDGTSVLRNEMLCAITWMGGNR